MSCPATSLYKSGVTIIEIFETTSVFGGSFIASGLEQYWTNLQTRILSSETELFWANKFVASKEESSNIVEIRNTNKQ